MYVQKSSDKQPLTNNDDLSRKERIKVAYQQWVSVTTWHGVPDAFRADSLCPKLFWGLVLLGATVMLIYQLVNVIDDYASNSHYVTAVAAVQLDSGAPWPNITICNYNRANSSKLSSIKMNPEAVSYIYGTLPQYYMTSAYTMDASVFQNLSDAYQIFLQFYSPAPTVNDIFNYIGHDCAPMMIGCWWTGLRFNCCDNVQTILSVYGKCYSVTPPNSDPWLDSQSIFS